VGSYHASVSSRRSSIRSRSRQASPFRPESTYYERSATALKSESPSTTVSLSQIDMSRSEIRVRRTSATRPQVSWDSQHNRPTISTGDDNYEQQLNHIKFRPGTPIDNHVGSKALPFEGQLSSTHMRDSKGPYVVAEMLAGPTSSPGFELGKGPYSNHFI